MKNLRTLTLSLFAALSIISCETHDEPGGLPSPQTGAPTETGKPIGTQTSKIIGPQGGTIATSDGKLTLTFPQGAVKTETNISVQPVENKAWNGIGNGYEFGPDGSTFEKPVTFTYRYNEEEMSGATMDFLALAFQQPSGVWQVAQPVKVDKSQKTITGRINHFSWWSLVAQYLLVPELDSVALRQTKELTLTKMSMGEFPYWTGKTVPDSWNVDSELVIGKPEVADRMDINKIYLNGVDWTTSAPRDQTKGSIGFVISASEAKLLYTAPGRVPDQNPVSVSVELRHTGSAKLMLVSTLLIKAENTMNVDGNISGNLTVEATASDFGFVISAHDENSSYQKPVSMLASMKHFKEGKYPFDVQSVHAGAVNGLKAKHGSSLYSHCNESSTEGGFIIIEKIYKDGKETKVKGRVTGKVVVDHSDDQHCNHTTHETMPISLTFHCVVRM